VCRNYLTPLGTAAALGAIDLAQELLDLGAKVNPKYVCASPLFAAIGRADRTAVDFLLANGANPNKNLYGTRKPLDLALQKGEIQIAQVLLLHGADYRLCNPVLVGEYPFASFEWFVSCTGYSAREPSQEGKSLLSLAAKNLRLAQPGSLNEEEYRKKVKLLLDLGADPALTNE